MLNFIAFLGVIYFILFFVIYFKSIVIYLKIRALREKRVYKGFIIEQLDFFTNTHSFSELIYYLPFSRYFKQIKTEVSLKDSEIKLLWYKKYRLELYLAMLFVLGLFAIPVMEYIIYPWIRSM